MLKSGGLFHFAEAESESGFKQPGDNQYSPVHIYFIVLLDVLQSYVISLNFYGGVTANDEFVINFLTGLCVFNEASIGWLNKI